jgi:phage terminase small subunit
VCLYALLPIRGRAWQEITKRSLSQERRSTRLVDSRSGPPSVKSCRFFETHAPPDRLDDAAEAEWRRVAPIFVRNGLLTELDLDALTAYPTAWVPWRNVNAKSRQFLMVIKSPEWLPDAVAVSTDPE